MGQDRKRKWRWLAVGLVVLLLCGTAAITASLRRNEFAFLDRFHPSRVDENWSGVTLDDPARDWAHRERYMLIFENKDADAVLASLNRNLNSANGYVVTVSDSQPSTAATHGRIVDFNGDGPEGVRQVQFMDKKWGGRYKNGAEALVRGVEPLSNDVDPGSACIVSVVRDRPWLEMRVLQLRSWLHL